MRPERHRFALFGCPFEIRNPSAAVWRAIEDRLPPLELPEPDARPLRRYSVDPHGGAFTVGRARRRSVSAATVPAAADLVVDDVERALARSIDGRILVHAGAVRWRGRAILLPGRSGSGKSELVAALVRAGADYLSDEFAVLDRNGEVQPYRRPISLRRPSGTTRVAVETPEDRSASEPAPVGSIAFLRYRPGASWRPRRVSPGSALLGLLRNTLSCGWRLDEAHRILRRVIAAPTLIGQRGDAEEAAELLLASG